MTRTERDRPAALAASEASQAKAKRENALRDAAPEMLAALKAIVDCAGPGAGPEIGLALDAIQKATGDTA